MPHPCVVCGRSRMNPNNREEEYMFFGFPVNDEPRCRYWLEFCGREDLYKLTKKQLLQRMICSKHFQPQDFLNEYLDRLNYTAVPSVYDPKQSLYNITCVLCGKTRRDPPAADYDGTTFHHFPGEEFRCLKWLDFVGVDSYYRLTRKEILFCYICSKHFDRSQFVPGYKGRLIENAIPNIRDADQLDQSGPSIIDLQPELKLSTFPDKCKKLESLSTEVLESQACAACGRLRSDPRNKIERYKFHPFPAYEIGRCLRWCQFLGREDLLKMSPNQIRKLVLCSKHFQTKQNFNKTGPCDAVPTIKDISESENVSEQNEDDQYIEENNKDPSKVLKRPGSRPLVSSKKPKVDNKPAPLAKKRGKSRRPTSINIPRLDSNNTENQVKKLPLPPTTNWKIQLGDQFQPITINNVASNNVANNVQGNIKKIIVPFTGDISTLGAPIPVHSLSSIPPGLLIKINLPEQEQQQQNLQKASRMKKQSKTKNFTSNSSEQQIWMKNNQTSVILQKTKQNLDKSLVKILSMSTESNKEILKSNKVQIEKKKAPPHSLEILEDEAGLQVSVKKKQIGKKTHFEELDDSKKHMMKRKKARRRNKITGTMKRTMFPIRSEIRHFLRKMAPLMHRLPSRVRATLKLSIVNMVIDQL
ncbi:uncharacterized protein LOC115233098 isoform X1 [Formica exsecta]|uniref:uncharacterized protein LOC115233098 isoform X1 n=1 Tax=Formica exsecta TaxID=72781 RepID=UPI001143D922|nr:uncharacterized protein LOC115233098 isoform X1 [Formica exsecta]XP_029659200.1 uncharacterized protein LOC115233098 isoform X1 [Formica exsecta]XP_029659201.1 uncharacterized protein LOC115233098 isoform X1 [Formica exsecta]